MNLPPKLRMMLQRDLVPTAEIPAQYDECFAWISIRRIPENSPFRQKNPQKCYLIKRVEIRKVIVERYLQDDVDVLPNDCVVYGQYYAENEDELISKVATWVSDLENFIEGWKSINPLK